MRKIIFLICFLLFIPVVNAGSFSAFANNTSPTVGNTVKITVKASGSVGRFSVSSNNSNVLSGGGSSWIENSSDTFSFTAKNPGKAVVTISAVDVSDSNTGEAIGGSKTITINVKEKTPERPKSSVNYLSSLSVEGAELSPAFDKNTTEYEVTLEAETTKIKVDGSKENDYSSVTGLGELDVSEGVNNLEIVVTAENGAKRTYLIKATVLEQSPILVTVEDQEKSLVRKADFLPQVSDYFTIDSVEIGDATIPAYYNENINYYLVGLKDNSGNISLYRYNKDDSTYTKYIASSFSSINFVFLESDNVPKGYKKDKITINDKEVTCYTFKDKMPLVYGINLEDGKSDFYSYDASQNTIQKFVFSKEDYSNLKLYIMIGLGILCFVELLIIIKLIVSKKNNKNDFFGNENTNYMVGSVTEIKKEIEDSKKNEIENSKKKEKKEKVSKTRSKTTAKKSKFARKSLSDTGYIASGVSQVFDSSKKEERLFKKKNSDDDDMYHF